MAKSMDSNEATTTTYAGYQCKGELEGSEVDANGDVSLSLYEQLPPSMNNYLPTCIVSLVQWLEA